MTFSNGDVVVSRSTYPTDNKDRPFVVIETKDKERKLVISPITSSYEFPLPYHHIKVHHTNTRSLVTGLRKPCVVKCEEKAVVRFGDVVRKLGKIPPIEFARIQAISRKYHKL